MGSFLHMDRINAALGYNFQQAELLEEALTHPSCNLQKNTQNFNYQRLEFLGDSVLGLVISDMLVKAFPQESEGALARRKAALVESKTLAARMQQWGVAECIRMSVGEEASGGRQSQSILEDVCEALIGAVYLDGGFAAAYQLITRHWEAALHQQIEAPKDAKSALQELVQGRGLPLPEYQLVSAEGPAHEPYFVVEVRVVGVSAQRGDAPSKRKAEQDAAAKMLAVLQGVTT